MSYAGLLEILYTAICGRLRNFDSVSEALSNYKKIGFGEPKSILCDSKIVIEAAKTIFKSKHIQFTLCLQSYLLQINDNKTVSKIAPLFNKSSPDDTQKGQKGLFEIAFNKVYNNVKSSEQETVLSEMFSERQYLADKYTRLHFNPLTNESVCIQQSVQILRRRTVHCLTTKLLARSCRRNNSFEDTLAFIRDRLRVKYRNLD